MQTERPSKLKLLMRKGFSSSLLIRRTLQPAKVLAQACAEFFRQAGAAFAERLGDAVIFTDFFLIDPATEQCLGQIVGCAPAAAARTCSAATAALGIDAL